MPKSVRVSKLVKGVLRDWSDGRLSASQVQEHMENAMQDGWSDPLAKRLGSMPGGKHAHESMMAFMRELGVSDLLTPVMSSPWQFIIKPST